MALPFRAFQIWYLKSRIRLFNFDVNGGNTRSPAARG
jgi:hypothetical protein